ncbi:GNAT family N-acetyltransferase [Ruficoccus amylovorans]|uniref:GNAT family N-acetyltransferase n=1 Tax=Ruficoccus amylovorans TaxID=1804625 RepID=A0A842HLF4_9BACT|nr:GNAT family N-acetyltransferase [Ruficoccus amylovorans]MBC2596297.1 GNAT family N-acetyltransferase [Ruficoccus amylovorans]
MKPLDVRAWPKLVRPGSRVFIGSTAACPHALVASMLKCREQLKDIELVHIFVLGGSPWAEEKYHDTFKVNCFFLSTGTRESVNAGWSDYTPSFLSDVPALFKEAILPLDVALIQVSPPDEMGFCSLGVSVDVISAAVQSARCVIAQVNPRMPRTMGESFLHSDEIDYYLEAEADLPEWHPAPGNGEAGVIANYVAQLIEDGSTLQLGVGNIPDQVCRALYGHKHLGVHTEMFSDGVMHLMQAGVIDNSRKSINRGRTVSSFCIGTRALYDFVDGNPHIHFLPTELTNNITNIARNSQMVSINSAVEVDLTGQVAADSIRGRFYSGIGGMVDFMRGAALSEGGLPIIALPSTAEDGKTSRIMPRLSPGAGVVGSRADVHFVITEYGIATLRGRSIRERTLELIQIAHPKFRDDLLRFAREQCYVPPYQKLVSRPTREIGGVEFERVTLANEEYVLRPLHPSDERRLQEFFYSHTPETVQKRYGYNITSMTRERAHELVSVDQEKDLALGIFEIKGPRQRIHAVGRYYLDEDGEAAEIAFVVRETKRRHGMGGLLLRRMLEIGRKRGLSRLWAFVSRNNEPMIRLFYKNGGKSDGSKNDEDMRIIFNLQELKTEDSNAKHIQ